MISFNRPRLEGGTVCLRGKRCLFCPLYGIGSHPLMKEKRTSSTPLCHGAQRHDFTRPNPDPCILSPEFWWQLGCLRTSKDKPDAGAAPLPAGDDQPMHRRHRGHRASPVLLNQALENALWLRHFVRPRARCARLRAPTVCSGDL
jgi:hypothetical protein